MWPNLTAQGTEAAHLLPSEATGPHSGSAVGQACHQVASEPETGGLMPALTPESLTSQQVYRGPVRTLPGGPGPWAPWERAKLLRSSAPPGPAGPQRRPRPSNSPTPSDSEDMPAAKPRKTGTGILASRAKTRGPASTPAGPQAWSINPGDKTPPEMGSPHEKTLISATATSLSAGAGGRQEVRAHQPWHHPVFPTGWPAPPPRNPPRPHPPPGLQDSLTRSHEEAAPSVAQVAGQGGATLWTRRPNHEA